MKFLILRYAFDYGDEIAYALVEEVPAGYLFIASIPNRIQIGYVDHDQWEKLLNRNGYSIQIVKNFQADTVGEADAILHLIVGMLS